MFRRLSRWTARVALSPWGTVSKVLAPGIRIGWAIGEPSVVRRMALQKSDGGSCPFTQRVVTSVMRSNKLAEHIDVVTNRMRLHRDAMMDALGEFLPDAKVRRPEGGYFLLAELPQGVSGDIVAARAVDHGVEVGSGRLCFPQEDPGNFLALFLQLGRPADHPRRCSAAGQRLSRCCASRIVPMPRRSLTVACAGNLGAISDGYVENRPR